jgi:uncharacterized membrane protein
MSRLCYNPVLHVGLEIFSESSLMNEPDDAGQPTTAEILVEVERRRTKAGPRMTEGQQRIVVLADRFVFWLSKHWLAVFNTLTFVYVGLPFLAPVLMYLGFTRPAMVIHAIYDPLCHQLPHRSWFLFGPKLAYTLPELMEQVDPSLVTGLWAGDFVGNEALGYKVAFCQRDTAIYGAILLTGLLYGLLRRWWNVRSMPWWAYVLFGVVPLGVDGGFQFLSYVLALLWPDGPIVPHETTPMLRVITGALFGLATVWLAYPLVQETMDEFRETLHQRFGWE